MAGFDAVKTTDSITAFLKTIFTNTDIYEDGLLDDQTTPLAAPGQQSKPYILLRYGAMRPSPTGKSFGGSRWDDYYGTVDADCIAPTGRMARLMLQAVSDELIGFVPTDSNHMSMEPGVQNFVLNDDSTQPTNFMSSARFRYGLNVTGVSQPIPH